jgi:hopene-associated glycosyltransferase HpnB
MTIALAVALLSLAIWLILLFARGGFWREAPRPAPATSPRWPPVVAIVPARDEAEGIGAAIASLLRQRYPGDFRIVLVDDHSGDGTADIALAAARECDAAERLTIVAASPLPPRWTGKLWAVSEGLRQIAESGVAPEYVLLTDADIAHHATNLRELVARSETDGLDLASLMVLLRCRSFAERALIPAFVFFFAMLYPFAWVNDPRRRTAGAAGGCMLVRRSALARIGGIASIKGAMIDDCALGAKIKEGGRIWLGLTRQTQSLRAYPALGDIWRMIARTAYSQLHYSPLLLVGTVAGLAVTYLAPPALTLAGGVAAFPAALAWLAMTIAFAPILRLYRQPLIIAPLLPAIATFYLAATIDSARRHWLGKGGEWKGRVQQREPA